MSWSQRMAAARWTIPKANSADSADRSDTMAIGAIGTPCLIQATESVAKLLAPLALSARECATPPTHPADIAEAENRERVNFEERAAIAEHCGELSKAQAEVLAALHLPDLGPERYRIIDAVARELDRMAEIKRSADEFEYRQETSTLGGK
jgi:hypothetical protein